MLLVALHGHVSSLAPPNLVLFFLDDHGWGDLGANHPTTLETPHMDKLAAGGLRFTDFHVGYSVCTPSRAALLTGRLCPRTDVCSNFGPTSTHGMALTERLMPEVLSGYDSHMIGKWHLGHNAPYHPTYRGFKTWYGLPYSGDMGCLDATPQGCEPGFNRSQGQPACPALCAPDDAPVRTDLYGTATPLYDSSSRNCSGHSCNADIAEQPFDPLSLNGKYARRATQIVAQHCGTCKAPPFFLYMAFAHTHTPLAYAAAFENASSRPFGQVRAPRR
jgi:arylsulfatase G